MKRLRTYNTVWNVEKTLYSLEGIPLPFPLSFRQLGFFIGSLVMVWMLDWFPPLMWMDYTLLKYVGVPVFVTWFCTRKTLDGKRPHRFLYRAIQHYFEPQTLSRYKEIPAFSRPLKYGGVVVYRDITTQQGGTSTND